MDEGFLTILIAYQVHLFGSDELAENPAVNDQSNTRTGSQMAFAYATVRPSTEEATVVVPSCINKNTDGKLR
jgi:hypothetical protein